MMSDGVGWCGFSALCDVMLVVSACILCACALLANDSQRWSMMVYQGHLALNSTSDVLNCEKTTNLANGSVSRSLSMSASTAEKRDDAPSPAPR